MKLRLTLTLLVAGALCGTASGATLTPAFPEESFGDQRAVRWTYRYCIDSYEECTVQGSSPHELTPDPRFSEFDAELQDLADGVVSQHSLLTPTAFHGAGGVTASQGDIGLLPPPATTLGGDTLFESGGTLELQLDQPALARLTGHVAYARGPLPPVSYESVSAYLFLGRLDPEGDPSYFPVLNQQVGSYDPSVQQRDFDIEVLLDPGRYTLVFGANADLTDYGGVPSVLATASWSLDWTLPEPRTPWLEAVVLAVLWLARRQGVFEAAFRSTPR